MPWIVRKQGEQFCVYRQGADGEPVGPSRGCHPTQEQAQAQQRALYANQVKSMPGFTLFKEASGLYRWFSIYSNNFRDNDHPSEIISESSHKLFLEMVDKGLVDYPELWLWHVPYVWGKADWLDYADGFALASGTVYPGFEGLAENLAKESNLATSHGMPLRVILRDPQDQSVIRFHITKEISPLPLRAAANKRTGFVILKGDDEMPLGKDKKEWLLGKGIPEEFLTTLEKELDGMSAEAKASGVESKEASPGEPAQEAETEKAADPAAAEAQPAQSQETKEAPVYATRDEVAQVLSEVLTPIVQNQAALVAKIESLTKEVTEFKRTDAARLAAVKEATPPMSLREILAKNLIGAESAKIKEGDPLAEDKPKEKEATTPGFMPTIVPMLNHLIAGNGPSGK